MSTSDDIGAIVFDFDGTLVDSNELKVQAFYELFPADCAGVIRNVMATNRERSRFTILGKILAGTTAVSNAAQRETRIAKLAAQYNDIVQHGAATCPAFPDIVSLLEDLSGQHPIFVSSGTPEESLRDIITARGWGGYFAGVFGYPRRKTDVLRRICSERELAPEMILVVGDGESDREAAAATGSQFFRVTGPDWVAALRADLGEKHV